MTIATYAELVEELEAELNRADLAARIPRFIRLFEARMNRKLRSPDMEQTFTFTTVAGTLTYALTARNRQLREIYATTSDPSIVPVEYGVVGEMLVFEDDPGELAVTYSSYVTLAGLSDGNPTNWLLDDHPDAYLYGALARAHFYLKDYGAADACEAIVDTIASEIVHEANEKRLPAGPLQMPPPVIE